jgi:hypothetical protein
MEHQGLKELYEQVSGAFTWERWGLLSVLCDYILYYTQGDMLEIGCGESSIHLSKLAEKYNRVCYHVEFSKSGVENMRNTKGYFGERSVVYNVKSEEFFDREVPTPLALAFIDGDHEYDVAKYDFDRTWDYIVPNGYIFLHDTLPPDDSWKVPEKCGTVHYLLEDLKASELSEVLDVFTFPKSAFDVGLTIVRKIPF